MTRRTDPEDRVAVRGAALQERMEGQRRLARPQDYVYDKAQEAFWDLLDGTLHSEKAVDASIPQELWRVVVEEPESLPEGAPARRGRPPRRRERLVPPSKDIQRVECDQFVEGSTWWPGQEQVLRDWFINKDGFFPSEGRRIYNQYKPPPPRGAKADARQAGLWIDHVKKLWPAPAEHEYFFDYCAHMVQRPHEKCNAGIVLSGEQGIGKDAALLAVKAAVGAWNTKGIDPDELFSQYKPWLQTLMLVVDEVRPSKDEFHASSLYNILKPMLAAPPHALPLNDKYQQLRYVVNVMRVFITTNDWMAMYIPPNDRRTFIMHSTLKKGWHEAEGAPDYFKELFDWMEGGGGCEHVAAWLAARDLSGFNPKQEVAKTMGWDAVAATWEEPEDGVSFAIEALGSPDVVFGAELLNPQFDYQDEVAGLLKSPRRLGHRMQKAGYVLIAPVDAPRWQFDVEGARFRSRTAFVKQSCAADSRAAHAAIREKGRFLAQNRSSGSAAG